MSYKTEIINQLYDILTELRYVSLVRDRETMHYSEGPDATPRTIYINETSSSFELSKDNGMERKQILSSWILPLTLEFKIDDGRIDTSYAEAELSSDIVLSDGEITFTASLQSLTYKQPVPSNTASGAVIEVEFNVTPLALR